MLGYRNQVYKSLVARVEGHELLKQNMLLASAMTLKELAVELRAQTALAMYGNTHNAGTVVAFAHDEGTRLTVEPRVDVTPTVPPTARPDPEHAIIVVALACVLEAYFSTSLTGERVGMTGGLGLPRLLACMKHVPYLVRERAHPVSALPRAVAYLPPGTSPADTTNPFEWWSIHFEAAGKLWDPRSWLQRHARDPLHEQAFLVRSLVERAIAEASPSPPPPPLQSPEEEVAAPNTLSCTYLSNASVQAVGTMLDAIVRTATSAVLPGVQAATPMRDSLPSPVSLVIGQAASAGPMAGAVAYAIRDAKENNLLDTRTDKIWGTALNYFLANNNPAGAAAILSALEKCLREDASSKAEAIVRYLDTRRPVPVHASASSAYALATGDTLDRINALRERASAEKDEPTRTN